MKTKTTETKVSNIEPVTAARLSRVATEAKDIALSRAYWAAKAAAELEDEANAWKSLASQWEAEAAAWKAEAACKQESSE